MSFVEIAVMTIVAIWLLLAFALTDMQVRREEKSFSRPSESDRRGFAFLASRYRNRGRTVSR